MKNSDITIQSFVITTIIYALLVPVFFKMDNAFGEEKNFVNDDNYETKYSQQLVESKCQSSCPSNTEMCIAMRA